MEQNKANKVSKVWRTIAIVFIILFTAETLYVVWGTMLVMKENRRTLECYYDICEEYPEAIYEDNVCYCYDYGLLGDMQVVKTKLID